MNPVLRAAEEYYLKALRAGSEATSQNAKAFARQMERVIRPEWEIGQSLSQIADKLNEEGYTTYRGNRWYPMQVKRILNTVGVPTSEEKPHDREMERAVLRVRNLMVRIAHHVGETRYQAIADELNRRKIRNHRGQKWHRGAVERILNRIHEEENRPDGNDEAASNTA